VAPQGTAGAEGNNAITDYGLRITDHGSRMDDDATQPPHGASGQALCDAEGCGQENARTGRRPGTMQQGEGEGEGEGEGKTNPPPGSVIRNP
jgi:hypothetical protein